MFGSFFRRAKPDRLAQGPSVHDEPLPPARSLATFDRLGQTLVATLTSGTLAAPDAIELAAQLAAQTETSETRHLVLDLQNVQYMDSMCVGVLVELMTRLQSRDGRIALVNAGGNVEYLFKLTRLDRLFPICRDVMKAIEVVERAG